VKPRCIEHQLDSVLTDCALVFSLGMQEFFAKKRLALVFPRSAAHFNFSVEEDTSVPDFSGTFSEHRILFSAEELLLTYPHSESFLRPASVFLATLSYLTSLNQVLTMSRQLRADVSLTNHKYIAHQIALLYVSCPARFAPRGGSSRFLTFLIAFLFFLNGCRFFRPVILSPQQFLTHFGKKFIHFKARIEEQFDAIKAITGDGSPDSEPQMSKEQKDWYVGAFTLSSARGSSVLKKPMLCSHRLFVLTTDIISEVAEFRGAHASPMSSLASMFGKS
jgi:hypothetical protein